MKYAIFWKNDNDRFFDSDIVDGVVERDLTIKELCKDNSEVMYCKIYKSGEYSPKTKIK